MHKVLLGDNESESGMDRTIPVLVFVLMRVEGRPPMKVHVHTVEHNPRNNMIIMQITSPVAFCCY